MSDTPVARLPVKLHRRVSLVLTEDAVLAEELLARKTLAQDVAGRRSDRVLPHELRAIFLRTFSGGLEVRL